MEPDDFKIEGGYRYEVQTRVAFWATKGGMRLNVTIDQMTKMTIASVVTQLEKDADFWKLPGVHRADEKVGPSQFKTVDQRSSRIPPIPGSVKAFLRTAKKLEGLQSVAPIGSKAWLKIMEKKKQAKIAKLPMKDRADDQQP